MKNTIQPIPTINRTKWKTLKTRVPEMIRFACVGLLRTFLGISIIFTLYNIFKLNYILSNIIGYAVGFIVGFLLHKRWTFRSHKRWNKEVIPYLVIFGIGYLINLALLIIFVELLKLNENLSQVIAMAGFTIINYIGNASWTFRHKSNH